MLKALESSVSSSDQKPLTSGFFSSGVCLEGFSEEVMFKLLFRPTMRRARRRVGGDSQGQGRKERAELPHPSSS